MLRHRLLLGFCKTNHITKLEAEMSERGMKKIERALISVSDKTGVLDLATELIGHGVRILSTGGTAKLLRDNGINVRDVADYTGFPEMFEGRIKTLHPLVHGGILHRRDNPEHVRLAGKHGILPIDLVVVNLYPFEETIAKKDCTPEDAIENIDIGGPTMLRSAAKNWQDVAALVDPKDYRKVLDEMNANGRCLPVELRFFLSQKVFEHTCAYDAAIARYMFTMPLHKGVY